MSALKGGWSISQQKTFSSKVSAYNSENDLWFGACFMHTVFWFGTKSVEWELKKRVRNRIFKWYRCLPLKPTSLFVVVALCSMPNNINKHEMNINTNKRTQKNEMFNFPMCSSKKLMSPNNNNDTMLKLKISDHFL